MIDGIFSPSNMQKKNSVGNQGKDFVQFLCLNLSLNFLVIIVREPALFCEKKSWSEDP